MTSLQRTASALMVAGCCMIIFAGGQVRAGSDSHPIILTEEEIANAPVSDQGGQSGERFTIDSTKDDVERIQGVPDEKYFDGQDMVWYYGNDAVYFNFYGRVAGVDNKSGNLKVN
jgi:hypothetical protein